MNKRNEQYWLTNLRAIATVSVIILHVSALCVDREQGSLISDHSFAAWHIANIIDSFVRFGVPVFVMISGALLLPREISLHDFLKKRSKRLLLPFLFWSLMYTTYHFFHKGEYHINAAPISIVRFYFRSFIQGAAYHLWYVYMIFGLYLIAPVISPWVKKAKKPELLFLILLWLLAVIINQAGLHMLVNEFVLFYFTGYIGYFVMGFYIAYHVSINRLVIVSAAGMFLTGFIVTVMGTYFSTVNQGSLSSLWHDYLTLNVAMMAAGLFILAKASQQLRAAPYTNKICKVISEHSLGIYLVHVQVLELLSHFKIDYRFIHPLVGIPVTAALCLCISLLIIFLIRKIPIGKYISG